MGSSQVVPLTDEQMFSRMSSGPRPLTDEEMHARIADTAPPEEMVGPIRKSSLDAARRNLGPQPAKPSIWQRATTGLLDPAAEKMGLGTEFTTRALSGRTAEEAREEAQRPETPAFSRFSLNAAPDAASTVGGFTSPVGLATMGLGPAGKIPGAVGTIARGAGTLSAGGFAVQGASQFGPSENGEDLPATVQRNLAAGSQVAGGLAGLRAGLQKSPSAKAAASQAKSNLAKKEMIGEVLRPPEEQNPRIFADFDEAMPEIVSVAGGKDKIQTPQALAENAGAASKQRFAEFEETFGKPFANAENRVGLGPESRGLAKELISPHERLKYPNLGKLVDGEVLTIPEAQRTLRDINNILETQMNKSPAKQRVAFADPDWGWLEAVRRDLRGNWLQAYPAEMQAPAASAYRRIGAINSIRNLAERAAAGTMTKFPNSKSVLDLGWSAAGSSIPPFSARTAAISAGSRVSLASKVQEGMGKLHPDARVARIMKDLQIGEPAMRITPEEVNAAIVNQGRQIVTDKSRFEYTVGGHPGDYPGGVVSDTTPGPFMERVLNPEKVGGPGLGMRRTSSGGMTYDEPITGTPSLPTPRYKFGFEKQPRGLNPPPVSIDLQTEQLNQPRPAGGRSFDPKQRPIGAREMESVQPQPSNFQRDQSVMRARDAFNRQRGSFNADQPVDAVPAPTGKIYERPAQKLGDRGTAATEDKSLTNKLAYDVAKASTQETGAWRPPVELFKRSGINRFKNPLTDTVESWVLVQGKPVKVAPR